jgi:hypothetical protein
VKTPAEKKHIMLKLNLLQAVEASADEFKLHLKEHYFTLRNLGGYDKSVLKLGWWRQEVALYFILAMLQNFLRGIPGSNIDRATGCLD